MIPWRSGVRTSALRALLSGREGRGALKAAREDMRVPHGNLPKDAKKGISAHGHFAVDGWDWRALGAYDDWEGTVFDAAALSGIGSPGSYRRLADVEAGNPGSPPRYLCV